MGIMERIKRAFGGDTHEVVRDDAETPEASYLGTQLSTTGVIPDVSTSATDPAMHDVAASGVQPISKPAEIEREQNPEARRDNEVVRKP